MQARNAVQAARPEASCYATLECVEAGGQECDSEGDMERASTGYPFADVVTSESELREILGQPTELSVRKQLAALDQHCRTFISLAPFLLIGTTGAGGACDVSPRGDAPGFVLVLDEHTLAIPERPGNRRADSLRNIVQTSSVGLLFMIPGVEETLRVNGRARIVRDGAILDRLLAHGKRPLLAIGVEVEECFLQCAKALKRSRLWQSDQWPERSALPTLSQMLLDQARLPGMTLHDLDCAIDESYKHRLY
jgi:PPOX class probable FMN-dependent enzyme